jgi:hypothetical protein
MTNELRPLLTVGEWVKERHANCLRIAKTKPEGFDKAGWLEDAAYFRAILDQLQTVNDLSMMLRRMIWMAEREIGDTSMKALTGNARELLTRYGLDRSPLRDEPNSRNLNVE